MKISAIVLAGMMLSACSGGGNNVDDGGLDAADGSGGDTANGDVAADEDLGDAYGLRIPVGMQACAGGGIFAEDLEGSLEMTGRVTFKPGLYRLPFDSDGFELDLVEQVEWNKEPQVGTPLGPGVVSRQDRLYSFSQEFAFGARTMQLSLRVSYEFDEDVVELNDRNLLDWRLSVDGTIDPAGLYFAPCNYDLYNHGVYAYTMEGGDTLTIEACDYCQIICKNSTGGIEKAEVVLAGQTRTIDDPMRLGLWFGQHDWYGSALVYLGEPLNGVSALVLDFGAMPEMSGNFIDLFDADLQLIENRNVTYTERRPDW